METDLTSNAAPRLLDQVRGKIRLKHYSIRTEQSYLDWIKRYIIFHDKQHPAGLGAAEVEAAGVAVLPPDEVSAGGVDFFLLGFVAQAQKKIRNGNVDWANFIAGTAER
mgnify:CR=1 FL=1